MVGRVLIALIFHSSAVSGVTWLKSDARPPAASAAQVSVRLSVSSLSRAKRSSAEAASSEAAAEMKHFGGLTDDASVHNQSQGRLKVRDEVKSPTRGWNEYMFVYVSQQKMCWD